MSMQLVLSVNSAEDGKSLSDHFRWCWLGAEGSAAEEGSGDRESLRTSLAERASGPISAWLILPGCRVSTRELEYSEKEKKHLRNLLPFQLEDSVVGDVEDLHFALGTPAAGKVVVAYADKTWMQAAFAELAAMGIEVTRCWSAPLLQPLVADLEQGSHYWTLGLYDNQLQLRHGPSQGFSIAGSQASLALQLLFKTLEHDETLPQLRLRAANEQDLAQLEQLLPTELIESVTSRDLADVWALDYNGSAIDLCQGEFSRRLPIERWWKLWKSVAIFAGVCVAVYLGTSLFEINQLGRENLKLRQQIEATARTVIPQGRMVDPEKQLNNLLRQTQPSGQSTSLMELLSLSLPQISAVPSVSIKGIAYTGDLSELNINIQGDSFSAFEAASQGVRSQGLNAELLSVNAQGNVQTARLKINKAP